MRLFAILNFTTLVWFILAIPSQGVCQSYNTALGLRWGDGIGITARQRLLKRTSVEGIFYQHNKTDKTIGGIMLNHHMPVITKRLNLYAGGGFGRIFQQEEENPRTSYNALMVNAGLEFTIARLNLSWDFVPVIPVNAEQESMSTLTAFSLRYVLIKKSKNGLFENDHRKNHKKKSHKRNHSKSKRRRK
jgi:hypothetical protein